MTTTIKRRAATIKRRWSKHRKMLFAVTDPDGGLSEIVAAGSIDDAWHNLACGPRRTPSDQWANAWRIHPHDLRADGWRIWPCAVEWEEKDD